MILYSDSYVDNSFTIKSIRDVKRVTPEPAPVRRHHRPSTTMADLGAVSGGAQTSITGYCIKDAMNLGGIWLPSALIPCGSPW